MKYKFIDKQKADCYAGGSYLYEFSEISAKAKIAFFIKILKFNNLETEKIKIIYRDNEEYSDVIYRKTLSKEEIENRYGTDIKLMKVKGYLNNKKISISIDYDKFNIMIKTDITDEKEYKELLKQIF